MATSRQRAAQRRATTTEAERRAAPRGAVAAALGIPTPIPQPVVPPVVQPTQRELYNAAVAARGGATATPTGPVTSAMLRAAADEQRALVNEQDMAGRIARGTPRPGDQQTQREIYNETVAKRGGLDLDAVNFLRGKISFFDQLSPARQQELSAEYTRAEAEAQSRRNAPPGSMFFPEDQMFNLMRKLERAQETYDRDKNLISREGTPPAFVDPFGQKFLGGQATPPVTTDATGPVTSAMLRAARDAFAAEGITNPTARQLRDRAGQMGAISGVGESGVQIDGGTTGGGGTLSNFQFSTGDVEYDKFLNETFLPQFRAQFQDNPLAMYNAIQDPEFLKATVERVGRLYGPVFEGAKRRVQEDFNLRQSEIDLRRREQLQQFTEQEQEMGTARTRLGEDVAQARRIEARNYQTATQEAQAAFASAGRAFGGGRQEAERKLGEESEMRLGDIAEQERRRMEDLQRQQEAVTAQRGFAGEQVGLAGTELGFGRERELAGIEAQKLQMGREELATIRELAGQTMSNPQFNPRLLI